MDNTNEIVTQPQNPLLAKAFIPGETFTLPSKGLMYEDEELDASVKKGEIMVNPMVTFEELILKTPDRLLNGTGIEEVFRRCVPQVLKPLDLFAKDLDYILICLRKITYGDEITVGYQHHCEDKERTYSISLSEMMKKSKNMQPRNLDKDYTVTLPNGQVVKVRPPRYRQILKFYQAYDIENDEAISPEGLAKQIVENSVSIIHSVDGVTDKDNIREWVQTIPSSYVKMISDVINTATEWGPDLNAKKKCQNCGEEIEIEVSLNPISFFS